jgi:hypothetical protein
MGEAIASGRSPARQQNEFRFLGAHGRTFCARSTTDDNILVADNGSPASQRTLASEAGVRFLHTPTLCAIMGKANTEKRSFYVY